MNKELIKALGEPKAEGLLTKRKPKPKKRIENKPKGGAK